MLRPHYETAQKMLGANLSPQVGKADILLKQVGREMTGKDTFHKNVFTIMSDGGGKWPRWINFMGSIIKHPFRFLKLLLWPLGKAASISILLVMQTDNNHLKLEYKPRWWRFGKKSINSEIPEGFERSPSYIPVANETARRLAKEMDGIPLSSFPEVILNMSTTAHILGGAVWGIRQRQGLSQIKGKCSIIRIFMWRMDPLFQPTLA